MCFGIYYQNLLKIQVHNFNWEEYKLEIIDVTIIYSTFSFITLYNIMLYEKSITLKAVCKFYSELQGQ